MELKISNAETLAAAFYKTYCHSVGGRAHDGSPLPEWAEFVEDPSKKTQSGAWIAVGELALRAAANVIYLQRMPFAFERATKQHKVRSVLSFLTQTGRWNLTLVKSGVSEADLEHRKIIEVTNLQDGFDEAVKWMGEYEDFFLNA